MNGLFGKPAYPLVCSGMSFRRVSLIIHPPGLQQCDNIIESHPSLVIRRYKIDINKLLNFPTSGCETAGLHASPKRSVK